MRARALVGAVLASSLLASSVLAPAAHAVAAIASATGGPAAHAAAPTPPLQALRQARAALRGLTTDAAAYRKLGAATTASLWVDPDDAAAPPAGHAVFADTRGALIDLEPQLAASTPPPAVTAAETLILAGDRHLAENAIHQAAGGAGLLARANGMVLSGDRWAATVDVDLAAEQYGTAWSDAFGALTPLVVTPATNVPPTALASAADNALASHRLAFSRVQAVHGQPPLTRAGEPEMLLVSADSCAACALESWGIVEALSQFGTFANLHLSQSATTRRPIVMGFTFRGASYGSPYVALAIGGPSSKVPRPLPFLDVANKFADVGSPAPTSVSAGLSWRKLAGSLSRPNTPSGQSLDGTAELLTAEICEADGGAPAAVCGATAVQDYESRLPPATPQVQLTVTVTPASR
jgi:Domain of unknown function (DUF929)